ncbi:Hypothetical protein FKW44_020361, partial [Caligus rogercresseyi]
SRNGSDEPRKPIALLFIIDHEILMERVIVRKCFWYECGFSSSVSIGSHNTFRNVAEISFRLLNHHKTQFSLPPP